MAECGTRANNGPLFRLSEICLKLSQRESAVDSIEKATRLFDFDASTDPRNGASGVLTCSAAFWHGVVPGFYRLSPINSFAVMLGDKPLAVMLRTESVGHESIAVATPFASARRSVDVACSLKTLVSDPCGSWCSHGQRVQSAMIMWLPGDR